MKKTIFLSALLIASVASADFAFTYRGRLDLTGHATVTNLPVKISAYAEATGSGAVWSGSYTVTPSADGLFQVLLSGDDLETAFKNGQANYLGVSLNGADELYPRQQILVAPFATRAATAEHLAANATVGSLEVGAVAATDVQAGAVTVTGTLKATDSSSTMSAVKLSGSGNLKLKGDTVGVFTDAAPSSYTFTNVTEGQTLFTSDRGGLVTLITDDNWTSPCVTWFVGAGDVKAPFKADGAVRVYHYPFGAN